MARYVWIIVLWFFLLAGCGDTENPGERPVTGGEAGGQQSGEGGAPTPTDVLSPDEALLTATVAEPPTTVPPPTEPTQPEQPTNGTPAPPTETVEPTEEAVKPFDPSSITVALEPVVTGLDDPLAVTTPGDGSGRLFVVEKGGTIKVIEGQEVLPTPFLDISDAVSTGSEQGLLGLAFEPGRPDRFYINYTNTEGDTMIVRYRVSADPNVADAASAELLLQLDQPAGNHNGGNLLFGPDGYLWIGMGDGGGAGDRFQNAQNPQTLLGAMLRLDVSGDTGYTIPPDNPFADGADGLPEIWAIGLRNPWRYSFDRATGDLWLADVGQGNVEEVNHV
ncbi:MAG: PQQ-dependent sugar dehydrogenase, partial [Ardenticatenaceae bacterium]